jgi:nucleoside-diphosphate-sugar epimerase
VRGVDAFTPYYDPAVKWQNVAALDKIENFELVSGDLNELPLDDLLSDVDVVFHQAGQPGIRLSWADGFDAYVAQNVQATQRLLEAAKRHPLKRLVFACSSSVYGEAPRYPTTEDDLPQPHSPYGVTKLAAEHLCQVYAANWDVPTVSLRYFTVYGPRQRPDMALNRFVSAALGGGRIPLYGDGGQVRDFTFVSDVVAANVLAATAPVTPGAVINVAGGAAITVRELLAHLGDITGNLEIQQLPEQPGDVRQTGGTIDRARDLLGWHPSVSIVDGLAAQVDWHREQLQHTMGLGVSEGRLVRD